LSDEREPELLGVHKESLDGLATVLRVPNDAALAHLAMADLELGFDESNHLAPGPQKSTRGRKKLFEPNERSVDDHEVDRLGQVV
jgi:hypothetical protein